MSIEIIRLTPASAGLLRQVADDVFDGEIEQGRLAAYLADPANLMVLALAGDLVVGQVAAVVHRHPDQPTELYVDNLGVAPDFRRRGIARALMKAIHDLGRELDCQESWVATEFDNLPARRLYEGLGDDGEGFIMFVHDLNSAP